MQVLTENDIGNQVALHVHISKDICYFNLEAVVTGIGIQLDDFLPTFWK